MNGQINTLRLLKSKLTDEKEALEKASHKVEAAQEAQDIIQAVAQTMQQRVHEQIGVVVSRCLSGVFGNDGYEFRVVVEKKRGKTDTRLVFFQDGKEIDPVFEDAGGVLDITAFALRVSALLLARPAGRRCLVLDEPMKHLSERYRPHAVALLEALAEEFGIQFLIVTHSPELAVGKVIRVG